MRISFFLFLLVALSCKEPQDNKANQSLQAIKTELSGELLGRNTPFTSKKVKDSLYDISIYANHHNFTLTELDIHIKGGDTKKFEEIQNYYNSMFLKSEKDTLYSSWQTDSTEFILYKNSDSSILVNIFKRK